MSFQKMMDDLKRHIDTRFDELEERLEDGFVEKKLTRVLKEIAADEPEKPPAAPIDSLGLPSQQEAALVEAGYVTVDQLAAASDDELAAVDGVGKRTIEFIRGRVG